MPGTTVAAVMHKGVVSCRPETPLAKVAQMMAAHRIHSVVVWSDADDADAEGTLWGVVSDLDLARAVAAGASSLTAQTVASAPAVTIGPDAGIRKAAELMIGSHVTHLVVARRGRPVGMISTLDLARALADRHP